MKRKYYISVGLISVFLLGIFMLPDKQTSISKNISANNSTLNINNTTKRPMFSENQDTDLDVIATNADLVIIGKVISDGVTKEKNIQSSKNEAEKDKLVGIKPLTYNITSTKIKVKEVISGNCNDKEITLVQLGSADSDETETKVKAGKDILLLLKKHPNTDNVYSSVNFEDGIYEVDNSSKINVLSEKHNFKKYDELESKNFIKMIKDLRKDK